MSALQSTRSRQANLDELLLAEVHPRCKVLGPGNRYAIWVHGCPIGCAGCISPQWIPSGGGTATRVMALAAEVAANAVDGVTISGGEPFAQAEQLARFVRELRARRDLSVLAYSGYTIERLRAGTAAQQQLLSLLDILIDGPYLQRAHADLRWRGSSNQRIHLLTGRHQRDEFPDHSAGLQVEVTGRGDVQWLGVPPVPGFRSQFERALRLIRQQLDEGEAKP